MINVGGYLEYRGGVHIFIIDIGRFSHCDLFHTMSCSLALNIKQ